MRAREKTFARAVEDTQVDAIRPQRETERLKVNKAETTVPTRSRVLPEATGVHPRRARTARRDDARAAPTLRD